MAKARAFGDLRRRLKPTLLKSLLGGQGFGLGFEDGEDFDEVGELENLAGAALEAEEGEGDFEFSGKFEAFDERGDAGAIDVFHVGEIDDDAYCVLYTQHFDEFGAKLRGIVKRDVTVHVHDCSVAGLSSGKIHAARFLLVVALAREVAGKAGAATLFPKLLLLI